MAVNYGTRYTRPDTQSYFDAYSKIRRGLRRRMAGQLPDSSPEQQEEDNLANIYISSDYDSFFFGKEFVNTILDEVDQNGKTPDYLMIHLAAQYQGENTGKPTIVIMGSWENSGGDRKALDVNDPSGEQPNTGSNSSLLSI